MFLRLPPNNVVFVMKRNVGLVRFVGFVQFVVWLIVRPVVGFVGFVIFIVRFVVWPVVWLVVLFVLIQFREL